MDKLKYYHLEQECSDTFNQLGTVFNANTPEMHPTIFNTVEDYMAGMSIFGICAMMYPKMQIYAFQLMSNHVHMVVSSDEDYINEFFNYFTERLDRYFDGKVDLSGFKLKLHPVNDLAYFRNCIVYTNRNGFVVCDNFTPFSYPWGTSPYYFQPMIKRYATYCTKPLGTLTIRKLMHTKSADQFKNVKTIDGYVSPLEFCDIATAESMFRDAKQYFYYISRKVETYSEIAKSLGESVYYNDNDLFIVAKKIASNSFECEDLRTLAAKQKIEIAKRLHYDHNASVKQLQRILNINPEILESIF